MIRVNSSAIYFVFFFSSRRRHTRFDCDWSSDVCSSDLEAIAAMKAGMTKGELFPLFCGAAELTYGTRALLSKLVELIPAPNERPPVEAQRWGSAERVTLKPEDTGRFVAQVFKTISEPHVGDVTFFRVRSEEHTSELQSQSNLVCRLLLEKKKQHV